MIDLCCQQTGILLLDHDIKEESNFKIYKYKNIKLFIKVDMIINIRSTAVATIISLDFDG